MTNLKWMATVTTTTINKTPRRIKMMRETLFEWTPNTHTHTQTIPSFAWMCFLCWLHSLVDAKCRFTKAVCGFAGWEREDVCGYRKFLVAEQCISFYLRVYFCSGIYNVCLLQFIAIKWMKESNKKCTQQIYLPAGQPVYDFLLHERLHVKCAVVAHCVAPPPLSNPIPYSPKINCQPDQYVWWRINKYERTNGK